MAAVNETGFKTFTATAVAIAKNIRVQQDSDGKILAAGVTDDWIGTTTEDVAASGTGTVRLRNSQGSHFFTASAAVTRGAKLYAAASGKVDDGAGAAAAHPLGFEAAEAATADGDIIEAVPSDSHGTNIDHWFFQIQLAAITGNGDVLTTWTPGFSGTILATEFFVTTPVTTGAKATDLNLEIGTTNLTGGVVALTSANCTPLGARVAGSAVTAANTFSSTDTISIESANTTAFAEGQGVLVVKYART